MIISENTLSGEFSALPPPDPEAVAHSARLVERIETELTAAGGRLGFERYMALALSEPGLGYYSAGTAKFGPAGDFSTAPELSALFSRCLARQCAEVLSRCGGGVLELGAGSGVMAADLLAELAASGAPPERYLIVEPSAELRARQQALLTSRVPQLGGRVAWLDRLPHAFTGVILANEVLDALPAQRFEVTAAGPRPLQVGVDEGRFVWRLGAAENDLCAWLERLQTRLGRRLAVGYRSERQPLLTAWLAALGDCLSRGAMFLIDYGYPRNEYYHPQRRQGTLICHYRHRAHDDPFLWPGLQDISVSVDFSAVADAVLAAGLTLAGYTSQSHFLLGCGLDALLAERAPSAGAHTAAAERRYLALAGAAKRLTLPGEMGEKFKVLAASRGLAPKPLRGFGLADRRQRL